jgi:hypothetical protein
LSWKGISLFAVLRSFEEEIFVYSGRLRMQEYCMYSKACSGAVGEKIHSKPATSLFGAAQGEPFLFGI